MSAAKVLAGGTPKNCAIAGTAARVRSKCGSCCSEFSDVLGALTGLVVEEGACSA